MMDTEPMNESKTIEYSELTNGAERETCAVCGMVANLDPFLHAQRYGHQPEVVRDGVTYRFSKFTSAFTWKVA